MIKPSIGRKIWYWPGPEDKYLKCLDIKTPFDATVVFVHDSGTINVLVLDHEGSLYRRQSIPVIQEGELKPDDSGFCVWMPYQIGQAAKTQEAEAKAKAKGGFGTGAAAPIGQGQGNMNLPFSVPGLGGLTLDTLEQTDARSKSVQKAPRVSLDDIRGQIALECYATALQATLSAAPGDRFVRSDYASINLSTMTLCILTMRNGWTVIGKAAPASPENFNESIGKRFAYEDAIRQLWPLMGYALRDRMYANELINNPIPPFRESLNKTLDEGPVKE